MFHMYAIETNGLVKKYGGLPAVDHVNMHIPEGAIYGFVGENGSGKTTIMRLISGLAEPTEGTFALFGVGNKDRAIYQKRKEMSAIVEAVSFVPTMTAKENMIYQEDYLGIRLTDQERDELLKKVHLENVGKKKVKNFSLGMRQRLGIALCLMNKPKFMMLDEPMNGLDPQGIAELRDLLVELNKTEGITVLISSHILSELEKIATHYGFISHGRLLEELTVEELNEKGRKSLTLSVDDKEKTNACLASLGLKEFTISPAGEVRIYDDCGIADVVTALAKAGVKILTIRSNDESVEEYYLNLVGGHRS